MSVLIHVEQVLPVELGLILPEISQNQKILLGLTFNPKVMGVDRFAENKVLPDGYYIRSGKDEMIGIVSLERDAIVSVGMPKEVLSVFISPDGWRTAFEYSLAIAVAIALAEYSASNISDSALVYSKVFSQSARDLREYLRSDHSFGCIRKAEQSFAQRIGWQT
jgi:hypothetical protein